MSDALKRLGLLVRQAEMLAGRYDAVVANPPYMGSRFHTPVVKKFLKDHYKGYQKDMFSAFIDRDLAFSKLHGRLGFMSPFVWMFISSHQRMRTRLIPDYSWDMLIRASNPAFSCGRSPVSPEALSIRLNRLKNRTIEPVINHLPTRGTVTRRQVDFPARNSHRFGPFHGPDSSSVHYPGAQDTRASLFHNRFQSVAP